MCRLLQKRRFIGSTCSVAQSSATIEAIMRQECAGVGRPSASGRCGEESQQSQGSSFCHLDSRAMLMERGESLARGRASSAPGDTRRDIRRHAARIDHRHHVGLHRVAAFIMRGPDRPVAVKDDAGRFAGSVRHNFYRAKTSRAVRISASLRSLNPAGRPWSTSTRV